MAAKTNIKPAVKNCMHTKAVQHHLFGNDEGRVPRTTPKIKSLVMQALYLDSFLQLFHKLECWNLAFQLTILGLVKLNSGTSKVDIHNTTSNSESLNRFLFGLICCILLFYIPNPCILGTRPVSPCRNGYCCKLELVKVKSLLVLHTVLHTVPISLPLVVHKLSYL